MDADRSTLGCGRPTTLVLLLLRSSDCVHDPEGSESPTRPGPLSTSLHCGRQDVENEPGALPAPAGHPAFAPGALAPRGQPQPNAQIQALNMLPASARVLRARSVADQGTQV